MRTFRVFVLVGTVVSLFVASASVGQAALPGTSTNQVYQNSWLKGSGTTATPAPATVPQPETNLTLVVSGPTSDGYYKPGDYMVVRYKLAATGPVTQQNFKTALYIDYVKDAPTLFYTVSTNLQSVLGNNEYGFTLPNNIFGTNSQAETGKYYRIRMSVTYMSAGVEKTITANNSQKMFDGTLNFWLTKPVVTIPPRTTTTPTTTASIFMKPLTVKR